MRNSSILDCLTFIVLFSYFYYSKCFVQKEYSFVFGETYEECTYSYRQDACEANCNESEPACLNLHANDDRQNDGYCYCGDYRNIDILHILPHG